MTTRTGPTPAPPSLGPRRHVLPADAAIPRPEKVIDLVRNALRTSERGLLESVQAKVDHEVGRGRQLPVDVLLAAAVAYAATHPGRLYVRGIAQMLRSLDINDQRVLGVRWTSRTPRPNGPARLRGNESWISDRQVEYLFTKVAEAFCDFDPRHNHWFVQDGEVVTADGEILGPLEQLPERDRVDLDCRADCPMTRALDELGNRLLNALWEYTGMPVPDRFAVDSTVIETHFAAKSYGAKADIDPAFVPETGRERVGGNAARPALRGRATEPRVRRSRRPLPAGPVVGGEGITSRSPDFPQLGPEGRLVHTKDHGARSGYLGGGATRPSRITNRRDFHPVVASGHLPDGSAYPPFAFAYNAVPGGHDKVDSLLGALSQAVINGAAPCEFSADRIYSGRPAERLEHVLRADGWTLTKDLNPTNEACAYTNPASTSSTAGGSPPACRPACRTCRGHRCTRHQPNGRPHKSSTTGASPTSSVSTPASREAATGCADRRSPTPPAATRGDSRPTCEGSASGA